MNYLSPKKKKPDQVCPSTRLFEATYNGRIEAVIELAKNGIDLNVTSESGITPLHLASMLGNNEMVKLLIKNGAKVNCAEKNCLLTPLHFASIRGNVRNLKNLIRLCKEVVNRGSDIVEETSQSEGLTRSNKSYETVILTLVKKGADLNAEDVYGKTPLHLAVHYHSETVKVLVGLGADVDVPDNEGRLPWHYAVQYHNYKGLQWLLAFGADINDFNIDRQLDHEQINYAFNHTSSGVGHLILEQLTRLRAAGLPFSSVYAPYFATRSSQSYYNECEKEIRKMMDYEIGHGATVYSLLHMSPRRKAAFTKTTEKTESMLVEFESKFPNYYGIIRACFFDQRKRKPLIKAALSVWYEYIKINIPHVCVEHILSFLDICCLKTMVEGVKRCHNLCYS